MPTVSLRIPAEPEHVRLARLVASAAARRCGVDEDVLDEVRLAVGEACSIALARSRAAEADDDIVIELNDDGEQFAVIVYEGGPLAGPEFDDQLAFAVISSIVPECVIDSKAETNSIRMIWPTPPQAPA
ncbi:MAG: ATP-binding protein [Actinomycetes bacterium]